MIDISDKTIFIDTNALDSLNLAEFARLMEAAKRKDIRIVLSKVVVWEYAKHLHQGPNEKSNHGARAVLSEVQKGALLFGTFYGVKTGFQAANIGILDLPTPEDVGQMMAAQEHYFKDSPKNLKDANIACTAIQKLDPKTTIIVCGESRKKLSGVFSSHGFTVEESLRKLPLNLDKGSDRSQRYNLYDMDKVVEERKFLEVDQDLMILLKEAEPAWAALLPPMDAVIIPVEQLPELPATSDQLVAKLTELGRTDDEIRTALLGNAYAFRPAPRTMVIEKAKLNGDVSEAVILSNLSRLVTAGLLSEVGESIIPNTDNPESLEIGASAMSAILDDILRTGGLND